MGTRRLGLPYFDDQAISQRGEVMDMRSIRWQWTGVWSWILGLITFLTAAFPARSDARSPQLQIATYLRGDSLWHVDVYVALPEAWIAAQQPNDRSALYLELDLLSEAGKPLQRKQQKVYLKSSLTGLLRLPAQTSNFFQVGEGRYSIRAALKNEKNIIWTSEKIPLHLTRKRDQLIFLSDLVPVAYPRISVPPFDAILWPKLQPISDDFYLYYEIHSEVPDTFITMTADLIDANGRTIRHERYRLYVGEFSRQDYLRIQIQDIPEGDYTLILRAGESDSAVRKTFRFRVAHAYSVTELNPVSRIVWQKNR